MIRPIRTLTATGFALLSVSALSPLLIAAPGVREAKAFLKSYNTEMFELYESTSRAAWVAETFITEDTEALSAAAQTESLAYSTAAIRKARTFDSVKLDESSRRQLKLIKLGNPSPKDRKTLEALTDTTSKMSSIYGKKKVCEDWTRKSRFDTSKDSCLDLEELTLLLAESKDSGEQLRAWNGWHSIGAELKPLYEQFVSLSNTGAKEGGFQDTGEYWRSNYDMTPAAFESEMERLWQQVAPLYEDLQCYMGNRLESIYPGTRREDGLLPAHLLGNMWAQDWSNLYSEVEPFPGEGKLDLTQALIDKKYDPIKMTKLSESFFTSLGFDPLPETFYQRSLFVKPQDHDVICHASAWDVTSKGDLRIKMCIQVNEENFITLHHELGHIFYYQSYLNQPIIFQSGANDGFHEAIGDAVALSVNAKYLDQVGLIEETKGDTQKALINLQMRSALSKIAFLPFGYLMDKWRWDVFSGKTKADDYNKSWWNLRAKYQGVGAPADRGNGFDPGAKYHIPANVPYARYFLAHVLQFQMFQALCDTAGHKGPLAECSLYGQKAAGEKLKAMLALGASKPWPEALKLLTGKDQMDAGAMVEYFSQLQTWLRAQSEGKTCSWKSRDDL